MFDIEIDTSVFNTAYIHYLSEYAFYQIYFGGSSSGKSVFLAQRDIYDILKGGRNFLICRQIGRTLRGSVIHEIIKVISAWGLQDLFTINKTDGTITCVNGYQIVFVGLDDVEKLKSIVPANGVFTDIRIEEATEVEQTSLKQLEKRLRGGSENIAKRITLSFNPIINSHWIYQKYFSSIGWADDQRDYKTPELSILHTTYKDNKFLTDQDKHNLESEKDQYYYDVYTLGKWGILGDVIFRNWTVEDLADRQAQFTNHRHGLDFGFSSDPAAMVITHYDRARKTIYIYDELYERGLTNDLLADEIKERIASDPVTCDSSEPKSVQELNNYNVSAYGAKKGKDSVNFGIQWLQQQTIIIDKKCINAKNEISTYHWKQDKDGNTVRQPIDKNNHLIDALRYAYEGDMIESESVALDDPSN